MLVMEQQLVISKSFSGSLKIYFNEVVVYNFSKDKESIGNRENGFRSSSSRLLQNQKGNMKI
jgi:hypothetical protein